MWQIPRVLGINQVVHDIVCACMCVGGCVKIQKSQIWNNYLWGVRLVGGHDGDYIYIYIFVYNSGFWKRCVTLTIEKSW